MINKIIESDTIEFKRSLSQLDNSLKTICAFLNLKGGIIEFGKDNIGNIIGIEVSEFTLTKISQKINSKIKPEIIVVIEKNIIDYKEIIRIIVPEGHNKPYFLEGVAYIRVGAETIIMPPDKIKEIIKEQQQTYWELQICQDANLDDIDENTITKFIDLAKMFKSLPITSENKKTILKKLGLIKDEKILFAGILLFGKYPTNFILNNTLRCGRFKNSTSSEFIDLKDYDGNLFQNIESGISFLKEHMKLSAKIVGLYRKETWEIPIEVLREGIINALIHRDYSIHGNTYIKVYDEQIIISNPGYLMKGLDLKELYKDHLSVQRNELLAKTFYYTGLIDSWGKGITNIINTLKKENIDIPTFKENMAYFSIIFNRPKIKLETVEKSTQKSTQKIIKLIKNNSNTTIAKLSIDLGLTPKAIKKNLSKLKLEGKLKRIGPDKGGYWKIINKKEKRKV